MVGSRAMLSVIALLLASLVVAPASHAQAPGFLLLGTDPAGDGTILGEAPALDTWVDINSFSVATVGEDLVFHMGLEGTTTEVGTYCWMAAFEFGGTEYVGLECFEGVAYEDDHTVSSVYPPGTSRGTNVASDVHFDDTGVVITVPLAAIGASVGDMIDDIYGLTYFTRALTVVDTIPDAKGAASADESLGAYRIGGPVEETLDNTGTMLYQNLTESSFLHDFQNATSDSYTLNFTVAWQNITLAQTADVRTGSANVTILRNGETLTSFLLTNETAPADNSTADDNATAAPTEAPVLTDMAGNWTLVIIYDDFTGTLGMTIAEHVPAAPEPVANLTEEPTLAANEDAPGPALPLLVFGLLAAVFVTRRRRI